MSSTPIHSLRVPDVYLGLETTSGGLTSREASSRLELYGANLLSDQVRASSWTRVLKQGSHPFILLSLIVIIISLWQRDYTLAFVILGLAVTNSAFSFWREYNAQKATDKLKQLLPAYAHVVRDGEETHISSVDLVPGDLLILAEGDNIAADARVVEEYGLRVNNAALTGEAVATRKSADASLVTEISELERPNLIFAGTSVASGTGKAVVYATGMLTQFGRIARLTQAVSDVPSVYQRELEKLGRIVTVVATVVGAIAWYLAQSHPEYGRHFPNPLLLAIGTIIAVTPEGLPATLTLSLAMAVQRLAGRGVLVKRLSIIETLGNVSVICTDKSGTLTQNQMTVREIWLSGQHVRVTGAGYEPVGEFSPPPQGKDWEADLHALLTASISCNNARLTPPSPGHPFWTNLGDQTEAALKVVALKAGLREEFVEMDFPRIHEIPFDARRKRMTTIHRDRFGVEIAFVKGAPREVLQLCSRILYKGSVIELTESLRQEILAANDEYARRALRVLAVAQRQLSDRIPYSPGNTETGLTFLGLLGMMDPPRPEVEQAIRVCRQAGIRITMITGDYGLTAESLARRVGMLTSPSPLILTGTELEDMSDSVLQSVLDREVIFARMAPEHKLRLVAAYQARGDVVAVTGDGVNDAPALRKADVGVSMGVVGTDVAREAADIILTNDNFSSITIAIEEGRAIFDNIRKFITYIFSSNIPEVFPFILTSALGLPPALSVRQILAIDMGTDILPAIALGTEKPEPGIMEVPPRKRSSRLIDRGLLLRSFLWLGMIETLLCFLGYFSVYVFSGNIHYLRLDFLNTIAWPLLFPNLVDVELTARTVFFVGVVLAQVGNAFACRTFSARNTQMGWGSNRPLIAGVVIAILILVLLVFFPPLQRAFDNVVIPPVYWPFLSLFAVILYSIERLRKLVSKRTRK